MATIGLFEAKQKLSELVERARKGEEIGITRHGKLVAKIVPAEVKQDSWKAVFADLDEYRKNLKGRPVSDEEIKEWINEGRE